MIGIVTKENIQAIFEEYGLIVAVKASYWNGTWLNFLMSEGLI